MWWRCENKINVAVVVYSFTIFEVLSVGSIWDRCRVDVGSMWSWMENTNNKIVEEGIKNCNSQTKLK